MDGAKWQLARGLAAVRQLFAQLWRAPGTVRHTGEAAVMGKEVQFFPLPGWIAPTAPGGTSS